MQKTKKDELKKRSQEQLIFWVIIGIVSIVALAIICSE